MSLGRLLTSGKSLVGLNDGECRYQMRAKNLLPKFGSGKNPFNGKPVTAQPSAVPAATAPAAQSLQSDFSRRLPTPTKPVQPAAAAALAEAEAPKPAALTQSETGKPGASERVISFLKKLNPLRWRQAKGGSAVPRFDKAPVQTELSLDRIKVVRNDLSEADVEIVPVKIAVQSKPEKADAKTAAPQPATPELIKT